MKNYFLDFRILKIFDSREIFRSIRKEARPLSLKKYVENYRFVRLVSEQDFVLGAGKIIF